MQMQRNVTVFIDEARYESPDRTTGNALYSLGNVPDGIELYREVTGDRQDPVVARGAEAVELTEFEHFHSGPPKEFTIIVNGRKKTVESRKLSFDQLVALAFNPVPTGPDVLFTITYEHGPRTDPQGTLLQGESVRIKDGMVFNVKQTDRS
jgi:hypothetical protein